MIPGAMAIAKSWWKAALGALVIFPAAFLLGQCSGAGNAKAQFERDVAAANLRAEIANAALKERLALERANATAKITNDSKGRTDAIDASPDGRPAVADCRLNRERLLQRGADPVKLPECR